MGSDSGTRPYVVGITVFTWEFVRRFWPYVGVMREGVPRIFSVSEGHIVLERTEGTALSRIWPIASWLALRTFITDNCGPGVRDPQPGAGGAGGAGGAAGAVV